MWSDPRGADVLEKARAQVRRLDPAGDEDDAGTLIGPIRRRVARADGRHDGRWQRMLRARPMLATRPRFAGPRFILTGSDCRIRFSEKPTKLFSGEETPSGRSAPQIGGQSC